MKKIIIGFFLFGIFMPQMQAQESPTNVDEFSKWQVRLRGIGVLPSEDDDFAGGDVEISNEVVPELDFSYFITKNISLELVLATTRHEVNVDDELDLGHVWLLPPTLGIQYHAYLNNFKPYAGVGVNYTFFYGVDEGQFEDIDYEDSVGFSMQIGADYAINDKWFINGDFKKLLLSTDVDIDTGAPVNPIISTKVDIDPIIVGLGVGMKF